MTLEVYSYRYHFSKTFRIAYPVMLSQLGHILVGIADSVMVGRIGAEPLAAASLANSIFHVLLMFGIGLSYGITPLVAQADGEGDDHKITRLLRHGLILCLLAGTGLFLLLFSGSSVLKYLDQPFEVVELAGPYLIIIAVSIVPLMFFQSFKQFAEGLSSTRQTMFITIASNVINVGLNYVLIFGKFGFPALGLNGAGWATLASRVFMAFAMFGFVYFAPSFTKFRDGFSLNKIRATYFKPMLKIGFPSGIQFVFEVGAFSFAAIMMGWLGTLPLAAHQIAISLVSLSYMMASGISAAATVRVGNHVGKKDQVNLGRAGNTGFMMVVVFMVCCALLFVAFHDFLPKLYVDDPTVISMAGSLIIVAAIFQISDGVQVVGLGALRGMSDVRVPTIITLFAYWVLAIPVSYLFGFIWGMGPEGVWYGLLAGLSVAALMLLGRFRFLVRRFSA